MNTKKVMLAVMCMLLAVVVVMACIFASRVSLLLQSLGGMSSLGGSQKPATGKPSGTGQQQNSQPSHGQSTDPQHTDPPGTQLSTQPPTAAPTEPDHTYVLQETMSATCDTLGYDILVCTKCGRQDIRNFVDPYGHNFGPGVTHAPTCTRYGYTRATCYRCGEVDEYDFYDPLGHEYEHTESSVATCETDGYDKSVCARCGDEQLENVVPALGHNDMILGDIHPASCTQDGSMQVQCTVCGSVREKIIPAAGHTYEQWALAGDTMTRVCEVCQTVQTVSISQLQITGVEVTAGEEGRMVVVAVGTETQPNLLLFTIYDRLNNESLDYVLTPDRGLVVTYVDEKGVLTEVVRYFDDPSLIIVPAESAPPEPVRECTLNLKSVTTYVGGKFRLKLYDPDGNKLTVTWQCDTGGIEINGDYITATAVGEHAVYTVYEGHTYTCIVTVR